MYTLICSRYQHHVSSKTPSNNLPSSSSNLGLNSVPLKSIYPPFEVVDDALYKDENAFSGEDDKILAECIKSGMSKTRSITGSSSLLNSRENKRADISPSQFKPDSSPKHIRNGTHRPRLPQKYCEDYINSKLPSVGCCSKTSNVLPKHNGSPRKTAIPVPTSVLNNRNSVQTSSLFSYPSDNKTSNPNGHVPPNIINDPRLIHPAMEQINVLRPRMDRRPKERTAPKMKRLRNTQDLQKKVCLNSFGPSRDEIEKYAVENSPSYVSLRSSLSDLTIDGSVAGVVSHLTSRVVSPHPEECIPENTNDSVCRNESEVESVSDPDY